MRPDQLQHQLQRIGLHRRARYNPGPGYTEALAGPCRALLRHYGLHYGAIDLVLTPASEYYFLEINPSGQFSWLEGLTRIPLFDTLADLPALPEGGVIASPEAGATELPEATEREQDPAAGVQAIQIEDQEMPKKCGHTPNRRVVAMADMVRRIEVAVAHQAMAALLPVAAVTVAGHLLAIVTSSRLR